jgi:tetratricopeptide (TPR) repeat protein
VNAPAAVPPNGDVAVGFLALGSIRDSTINIGIPLEHLEGLVRPFRELSATQKKLIAELEAKLDLNQRQVRAALDILGEKDIPPERLAAKLVEIAERFKAFQAEALAQPGDDAKVAALKAEAQKAIEAGDLAKADALLAGVESEQRSMRDRDAANLAETSGRRADIALARLQYSEAAHHFANAAAALPADSTHEEKRIGYLASEADALYRQGDEFGDNDALRAAIKRCNRLISLNPRERVPLNWAMTQNNLGTVLSTLGGRQSGAARLEEAVSAYRAALLESTRERVPLHWAATQNNLGNALSILGKRESGTGRLEEAVTAYRAALLERTRERAPLDWAATQNNLGAALQTLGQRESGSARLEEAVSAYRAALLEWTRERVPLDWAMTQNNLGAAPYSLGERQSGTARLEEAVAAYRAALLEWTRERVPLDWAMTQNNLGNALQSLGERESGAARLEEAVSAFRAALLERTRDKIPLQWAGTQNNLGNALQSLGEREAKTDKAKGCATLKTARDHYAAALEEFRRAGASYYVEVAEGNIAELDGVIARLCGG